MVYLSWAHGDLKGNRSLVSPWALDSLEGGTVLHLPSPVLDDLEESSVLYLCPGHWMILREVQFGIFSLALGDL